MKLAAALVFVTLLAIGIMSIKPEALTKKQCEAEYWKQQEKLTEQMVFRSGQCAIAADEKCWQSAMIWVENEDHKLNTNLSACLKAAKK